MGARNRAPYKLMKTIICDIDGTITNMWPIEKSVLLFMTEVKFANCLEELKRSGISDLYKLFRKITGYKVRKYQFYKLYNQAFQVLLKENILPKPNRLPLVRWIKRNSNSYIFVYATGGQKLETIYVLESLNIIRFFDLDNSVDKTNCRFSKSTGISFKKIKEKYQDCMLVTDTESDCEGAWKAGIPCKLIKG